MAQQDGGTARDSGPAEAGTVDAGLPRTDGARPAEPAFASTARQVRALTDGSLDGSVDLAPLFEVDPLDEPSVRIEVARLRAVVAAVDSAAQATPRPSESSGRARRRGKAPDASAWDAGADGPALDRALWSARLELDRARLAFLRQSLEVRKQRIAEHEARRRALAAPAPTEAEKTARLAAEEQARALEAARQAHTEAERLLAAEKGRLAGVASAQAAFEGALAESRKALAERAERTLALRRRVREIVEAARPDTSSAGALYDELRAWLRASRDRLAGATGAKARPVPDAGEDRMRDLGVQLDLREIVTSRQALAARATRLQADEEQLAAATARQIYEEVQGLNAARLSLLPLLEDRRRSEIVGFGSAGLDQAVAELRQVTLVLRYHLHEASGWMAGAAHRRGRAALLASLVGVKWIFVLTLFFWWRRRSTGTLERLRERVRERDRRSRVADAGPLDRVLGVVLRVHRPLETLLLAWAMVALLPADARGQLEVRLVVTVLLWTLGGRLAVLGIDAVAGARNERAGTDSSGALRLRSLRLVGRTIVVFGLILALSAQLVGHGTLYEWVFAVSWLFVVPVALVIIRWWRGEIFTRVEHARRKTAFETWVIAHRTGGASFPAAVLGGLVLFVKGSIRAMRTWIGRFDLTRRLLAHLFQRGLDRLGVDNEQLALAPLPDAATESLGPDTASATFLDGANDRVAGLIDRIQAAGGGVFAVVGERGGGKTTVLERVRAALPDVVRIGCPTGGLDALRGALARSAGLGEDASLDEAARQLESAGQNPAILIDDAQALIHPVMGGLAEFDRLMSVARAHSTRCCWVLALDDVIWRFFERARGARPLFDEVILLAPWPEPDIVRLVEARCRQARVAPCFDHLVARLPKDADEVDRAEAAAFASGGYYRLLWDHAAGNPGVALHMLRRSLGVDPAGIVRARPFRPPDIRELEVLPDPPVFVLRAVVQLAPARPEDVARATLLPASQVEDALRFGVAHGYLVQGLAGYSVTWDWFRTLTRFLQRRHLLATYR